MADRGNQFAQPFDVAGVGSVEDDEIEIAVDALNAAIAAPLGDGAAEPVLPNQGWNEA